MNREKAKDILILTGLYIAAFLIAAVPFRLIGNSIAATAVFTAAATVLLFIPSVFLKDVSVYDPYWSVAPPVMILANMIKYRLWNVNAFLLLGIILIWSVRLTGNWAVTYKGIGHEDWRYAMYREKYSPFVFQLISFFGLQFVPTAVVFAGLIGALFAIRETAFSSLSLIGLALMGCAVLLEFVSDRAIHRFLREHRGERKTCDVSVWKYSRHPNYLGEMTFWTGMYVYSAAACPSEWVKGLGFISILLLFLFVSIPMMEKHNLSRRPDYAAYRAKTSMLFLLPNRKTAAADPKEGCC